MYECKKNKSSYILKLGYLLYPKEPNPMNIINPNQGWDLPPNPGEHVSLIKALCTWDITQPLIRSAYE